ncbi:Rne/Rng family ribonuclease [Hymenobacter busanensis]|uniref:Rne/Rng family ribonuclease n=1 Tax=Hymenobacter busanensis TaxID=2607656 RepID=A0A7L5A3Y8_9BACT|nr:Rne/Rng family ribonuclease [Hymenobacter busanensis]KAA9331578.1 Rne/Rng family ribonuclease [Hymenobacter busanensis]QHJ08730.1 Rne/Rng family ribonuclease [Hymenobacter busanensis]
MSNELIINSTQEGERIALLQDKRLIEYHFDRNDTNYAVGDIFLGTVKKVMPGLNAAFIDIGYQKDAFLHYGDLGEQFQTLAKWTRLVHTGKAPVAHLKGFPREAPIEKVGKMADTLKKGQQLLVQIVKEPISTKGPRLSSDLSMAGRYLVLMPFSDTISVSKKIVSRTERDRLKRLIASIKPDGFGVIIRTVAEGRDVAELDRDMQNMVSMWERLYQNLRTAKPNDKVLGELGRTSSMIRDMLNESFDAIHVDSQPMYEELKTYLAQIAPDKPDLLKFYSGKTKVFEQFDIEKQLKTLFGKTVTVPGGGYLVIEHTEALHVIDVNSGNKSNQQSDQEATALMVNLAAAKEVARQLRLRDMGGIVVVDFIDMRSGESRKKVEDTVYNIMAQDRAKFTILPITKFGLLQITRQRVRPEQNIITTEVCPTCGGTGKITASILVTDEIDTSIADLLVNQNHSGLTLHVHPFLHAYYTKGLVSKQMKWYLKYYKWVKVVKDTSLGLTDYRIQDERGEDIELHSRAAELNSLQDRDDESDD